MAAPFRVLLMLFLLGAPASSGTAQDLSRDPGRRGGAAGPIGVYIDCSTEYCDDSYFRRKITYVNHVRDRLDADVYILVTSRTTGGGGTELTLTFTGRGPFVGLSDTLTVFTRQDEGFLTGRDVLTRAVEAGLTRYVARTALVRSVNISYADTVERTVGAREEPEKDPWRHWIFNLAVDGTADGEQQYHLLNLSGTATANHTTEDWRVRFSGRGSRLGQRFEIEGAGTYSDVRASYDFTGLIVRSLGGHWSTGVSGSLNHSTYANTDRAFQAGWAVEANVFPYAESSRRELTFLYRAEIGYVDYQEVTIFGRSAEWLGRQSLDVYLNVLQPWGYTGVSVSGRHVLPTHVAPDFETYSLRADVSTSVQVTRGLSIDVSTGVSLIRDQRHLPRAGASQEEILLRQKELATNYRYYGTVGLSYTFGSRYNNVVNPRMRR